MPEWATFVGFAFVVTAGLLVLSHASRGVVADDGAATRSDRHTATERRDRPDRSVADADADVPAVDDSEPPQWDDGDAVDDPPAPDARGVVLPKSGVAYRPSEPRARTEDGREPDPSPSTSTTSLLANVAVSQGLFGALLLVGAWYAEIPAWAFGAGAGTAGAPAVAVGIGLGVALYLANEAGAVAGSRLGFEVGDGRRLRGALAPDTRSGWALLLVVVLPTIAAFEELLFRGALVGVVAAGYGVSPWAMAVVASGAFALGHGAQGRLGMAVTGALGFVLAAAFVVTGSLLAVIVAHYLVNALEFVVHEGLGVEWSGDRA